MNWAGALRRELADRARAWAESQGLPYYASLGARPTILFERSLDGRSHGNFHPASWSRINARPAWASRLAKPHQKQSALPVEKRPHARELDSSNSSDALLMNCFCFPDASGSMLGIDRTLSSVPTFGLRAEVRLTNGRVDTTEVDLYWDGVLVEAKLTERDFTRRSEATVETYADIEDTFRLEALPRSGGDFLHYQLLRNVLAARQHDASFVLLVDERRPDLEDAWQAVRACIRDQALRDRSVSRTWQEVAAAAPLDLDVFLATKYGL